MGFTMRLLVLAVVVSAPVGLALSQEAAQANARNPSSDGSALQEIVVTAEKREERLNDVGMSVTAVRGSDLAERRILSEFDIANSTPGLSSSTTQFGNPVYTLRGIGFVDATLAAYPAVSVYLDQVSLAFPALAKHSNFDLDRIEVLYGPQGTLFGENSTGGAINYIASKPTNSFQAGGSLTYGRFDEVDYDGFVSGPLSDVLTARFAGRVERADGWQESNSRPGDTNADTRNYMIRLLLDYRPIDALKVELNLNGWLEKGQPQAAQLIAKVPQGNGTLDPLYAAYPFSPLTNRAADWPAGLPFLDNSLWQTSIRADLDLTESLQLTSISAFTSYSQRQANSADGSPYDVQTWQSADGSIDSFSQELRVANNGKDRLRWVGGLNFEHSVVDQLIHVDYLNTSAAYAARSIGYDLEGQFSQTNQRIDNYAAFANGQFDLTDTLTAKAGVRFTESDRSDYSCAYSSGPGNLGEYLYNLVLGGKKGPYVDGTCFPINTTSAPVGGVPPGSAGPYVGSLDQNNVSWQTGLDYKPQPGLLVYGNISKGYKAGVFPLVGATKITQYNPATQESVLAYEVGFKDTVIDRVLQINGAVFYYDYRDKQLAGFFNDQIFGVLDVVTNIPKSRVKGASLEVSANPLRGLATSATFTYLDAYVVRYSGPNSIGATENFAGAAIPFTPKYNAALNLDYRTGLSGSLGGFIGTTVNYRSATTSIIGGNVNPGIPSATGEVPLYFAIPAYTLTDVRIGIEAANDTWQLSLWGKNVFNTYYVDNTYYAFDGIVRFTGMPATYGVTFTYKYK